MPAYFCPFLFISCTTICCTVFRIIYSWLGIMNLWLQYSDTLFLRSLLWLTGSGLLNCNTRNQNFLVEKKKEAATSGEPESLLSRSESSRRGSTQALNNNRKRQFHRVGKKKKKKLFKIDQMLKRGPKPFEEKSWDKILAAAIQTSRWRWCASREGRTLPYDNFFTWGAVMVIVQSICLIYLLVKLKKDITGARKADAFRACVPGRWWSWCTRRHLVH